MLIYIHGQQQKENAMLNININNIFTLTHVGSDDDGMIYSMKWNIQKRRLSAHEVIGCQRGLAFLNLPLDGYSSIMKMQQPGVIGICLGQHEEDPDKDLEPEDYDRKYGRGAWRGVPADRR
jgi:hypothetical protein